MKVINPSKATGVAEECASWKRERANGKREKEMSCQCLECPWRQTFPQSFRKECRLPDTFISATWALDQNIQPAALCRPLTYFDNFLVTVYRIELRFYGYNSIFEFIFYWLVSYLIT